MTVCDGVVPPVGGGDAEIPSCPCVSERECCAGGGGELISYLGDIGHSILVPGPLTLISFALLILVAVTWAFGLAFYHRSQAPNQSAKLKIPLVFNPADKISSRDANCKTSQRRCGTSDRDKSKFLRGFRNPVRHATDDKHLMRNVSTHSTPQSIGNVTWHELKRAFCLQPANSPGRKRHRSPAELALAFFSKIDKSRSRQSASRCIVHWCQPPLRFTSSRKSSPASSCTEAFSQTSTGSGKSCQSEPPMPLSRSRYSLAGLKTGPRQCCCGSQDKGCAEDCNFCCSLNCGMTGTPDGIRAGHSVQQRVRDQVVFASSHGLRRPSFHDKSCARSLEDIAVRITKSTGICTESESKHSLLSSVEMSIQQDREIPLTNHDGNNSEGNHKLRGKENAVDEVGHNEYEEKEFPKESCAEKIMQNLGGDAPHRQDLSSTDRTRKHEVHDAATDIVRHSAQTIYHDKAVGDEKGIRRHHRHAHERTRDHRRGLVENASRHNFHLDKSVGHEGENLGLICREKETNEFREHPAERRGLGATSFQEHLENGGMSDAEKKRISERDCDGSIDRSRSKIIPEIITKSEVEDCTCSESVTSEILLVGSRAKNSLSKISDSSKMSFVLGDERQYYPFGISDRSIATNTSDSYVTRRSQRRHERASRKK
ncbi:uncharacterized protein [Neodiprion pinetum]|uniref:uncharacterized protein n=1 Tax=Neodiprion pinetum TaxID=441929 RepID=UPI001EDD5DE5|nr:uncharacterized protein LOC124222344 [Neodiprion pinetum]